MATVTAFERLNPAQRIIATVLGEKAGAESRGAAAEVAVKLPWSGTFHSIANRLIRRHAASVGLDANFSVLDRGDAADLMDVVRHELDLSRSEKRFPRKDTCLAIYSHRVNTRGTLADTLAHGFPWCAAWEEELTRLFRAYVERKLANQALDYDDLLLYWHAEDAASHARPRRAAALRDSGGRPGPGGLRGGARPGGARARHCATHFEASGHDWCMLASFGPPQLAVEAWPQFAELMLALGAADAPWEGQAGRVRDWYEPHLERIHEAAHVRAGDLQQLERIAQQFPTRERFLSELALDPPRASSDLAGTPLLDEDYLILSTIHSAKGQEWDAVHVLNVADGNFPLEFATGKAEQIEEERRLLYVAMTRSVLAQFEQVTWPAADACVGTQAQNAPHVDVAGILRGMW